jgi:hypothetical protein
VVAEEVWILEMKCVVGAKTILETVVALQWSCHWMSKLLAFPIKDRSLSQSQLARQL